MNFRSRPEVIDSVNSIFSHLMIVAIHKLLMARENSYTAAVTVRSLVKGRAHITPNSV